MIQYSLHVSNKPVFILALDAQSAFYRCLRQVLCGELYKAGVAGSAILYMDVQASKQEDSVQVGREEDGTSTRWDRI